MSSSLVHKRKPELHGRRARKMQRNSSVELARTPPSSLPSDRRSVDPFFRWVEDPKNVSYQVGGAADSSPHVVHVYSLSPQLQRASGITVQMSYRLV